MNTTPRDPLLWVGVLVLASATLAGGGSVRAAEVVVSLDADGAVLWSADLRAGDETEDARPWTAPVWFPEVPAGEIEPLDAGGQALPGPGGTVTLLDFWASWCAPCIEELPHLEAVHRKLADRGLRVVAVNVDDPTEVARATADSLGLTVELGRPSPDLLEFARPRSLPTLLLVDPHGRVRLRWDGYRPGMEHEVERAAIRLLDEADGPPPVELGRVRKGEGRYRVTWMRELDAAVTGVAVQERDGGPRVLAASGRDLFAYAPDGEVRGRAPAPRGTGRIVLEDVTGDGVADVVGWRSGADVVGVLDMERRAGATWTAEAPVVGVTVAAGGTVPGDGGLVLATIEGLRFLDGTGRTVARGEGVARGAGVDRDGRVVYLDGGGALHRLASDGTGRLLATLEGTAGAVAVAGAHVAWGEVTDLAPVDGDRLVVARGRDLRILDPAGGMVWSTRWDEPVTQVAVADLDGDGADEIVVAAGRRVVVVSRASGS